MQFKYVRQVFPLKVLLTALLLILFSSTNSSAYDVSTDFVSRSSTRLVAGGSETIHLRGINFSHDRIVTSDNQWIVGTCTQLSTYASTTSVTNWYSETHFQSIANIGFNMIRMNLHYRIFEDDSSPGDGTADSYNTSAWTFIDQYVQWARNNNIYLILDLHVPPGGYQPSSGGGSCLWDTAANQTRLINIWTAIATRYANEPAIAAYDLLNEPTPTGSTTSAATTKYQTLMQQTADAIRAVDTNHLIIVERVNWIFNSDGSSPLTNWSSSILSSLQVSITDSSSNTMYDYHFYDPNQYALQNEGSNANDGNYPDTSVTHTAKDTTSMQRDKTYLAYEMQLENRSDEVMFVGEWSPNTSTFTTTKGGLTYVQDVVDILAANSSHWAYYSMFNLYEVSCCDTGYTCCSGDNTTTVINQELIDLFSAHFSIVIPTLTEWSVVLMFLLFGITAIFRIRRKIG